MMDRFIMGESVKIRMTGFTGKIIDIKLNNKGETVYRVRFDNPQLAKPERDYYEKGLVEYSGSPTLNYGSFDFGNYQPDEKVDRDKQCPKCKIDWTITVSLHGEKWRDCESCGQKYEDLK